MITPVIHHFEEVGSTNDVALDMARAGAPEGTVVTARSQTEGRGRRGRSWFAKPGESVIVSVVLRPDIPVTRYSELAFVAAVAVAECLANKCGLQPMLKWPNDVLVRDKKITGILVEAAQGAAIVGIGLNVMQTELPPELSTKATSVAIEGGMCIDIEQIRDDLLGTLFAVYELPFEEILSRWRKYMWGVGCSVDVETAGGTLSGAIAGIDIDGALLITKQGRSCRVVAADAIRCRVG